MIIWISVIVILVVFSIISFILGKNNVNYDSKSSWCCAAILSFCVASGIFLALVVARCDYNGFIYEHEMKRDYINTLAREESNNAQMLYQVVDIAKLNEKLFDIKTRVMMYGPFSFYPESVLDIEPIKVP